MKKQVIVIHGGDTFDTYEDYLTFLKSFEINFEKLKTKKWKDSLGEKLGSDFEVVMPQMPNKFNAKYLEWQIWFEKLIPFFAEEVIFVGHSLGGIFLAKYLSENQYPKKIKATFLVAACFDDRDADYSLADFVLPSTLIKLQEQGGKLYLYHSKDDPVVPFTDVQKYQQQLPNAHLTVFTDRGHFDQPEVPELVKDIQNLWI